VACDAWQGLPVRTGVAAAVMSVFSPRNGAEMRRILRSGGALLVLTPTPRHLAELTAPLGLLSVDEHKRERLAEQLDPYFELDRRREHEWVMALGHADTERLVGMGPSSRHTDPATTREQVAGLSDPLAVTASVAVSVFRGCGSAGASRGMR